jgi:predicted branched-subunit amino acid permease
VAVVPGYYLRRRNGDPARYGIDLVMPIFFITMLVPIWRGRMDAAPWLVAVVVALAVKALLPGYWFVLAGGLAAAFTAAALFQPEEEPGRHVTTPGPV